MGDDFPDDGAIFDAVNDAIFIMNTSTGEVLEVNRAACQMFGYERDELIGINLMGKLSSGIPPYTEELAFERVGKTSVLDVVVHHRTQVHASGSTPADARSEWPKVVPRKV